MVNTANRLCSWVAPRAGAWIETSTSSICKVCPHGKTIPPGKCCQQKEKTKFLKFVSPLSGLEVKDKGKIAYLHSKDNAQLQKLISIGILPGMPVSLLQKFPSYVLQLGQSQFAIDKELASCIYVRLVRA